MITIFDTEEEAAIESNRLFLEKFPEGTTERLYGWSLNSDGKYEFDLPEPYIDSLPIEEEPPSEPTMQEIINFLIFEVQSYMDRTVQERGYDNILSACSYAVSTIPRFRDEGLAAVAWRDSIWTACYAGLEEIQAGTRSIPSIPELILELPKISWPD